MGEWMVGGIDGWVGAWVGGGLGVDRWVDACMEGWTISGCTGR